MALSPEELLDDNLQTYEELRTQVDFELGILSEEHPPVVVFETPKIEPVKPPTLKPQTDTKVAA